MGGPLSWMSCKLIKEPNFSFFLIQKSQEILIKKGMLDSVYQVFLAWYTLKTNC